MPFTRRSSRVEVHVVIDDRDGVADTAWVMSRVCRPAARCLRVRDHEQAAVHFRSPREPEEHGDALRIQVRQSGDVQHDRLCPHSPCRSGRLRHHARCRHRSRRRARRDRARSSGPLRLRLVSAAAQGRLRRSARQSTSSEGIAMTTRPPAGLGRLGTTPFAYRVWVRRKSVGPAAGPAQVETPDFSGLQPSGEIPDVWCRKASDSGVSFALRQQPRAGAWHT